MKFLMFDLFSFFVITLTKKQIIALGGINKNNLKKIQLLNVVGFAAVNLFKYY